MTSAARNAAQESSKIQNDYNAKNAIVKYTANGRWPEILCFFGIPENCLSGKHVACPIHGGKDGFRFTNNKNKGDWVCATCTSGKFKDGFALIALHLKINNKEAFKKIAEYLGLSGQKATFTLPSNEELTNRANEIKRKDEEKQKQKQLAKKKSSYQANKILSDCVERPHPYLQEKGINQAVLVSIASHKVTDKQTIHANALIIPIHDINDTEKSIGAQCINTNGFKQHISGTPLADGIHILEGDSSMPYVGVVEGYATGLSVHMATGVTVVIVFDANGMMGKAERLKSLFSGKQLVFFGDNDSLKDFTGNHAAYTAAQKTEGVAVIPLTPGMDWDDYRQSNGIEYTSTEINRQLGEYGKTVDISDNVVGLSITSPILLASNKLVSFRDALINHTSEKCECPITKNSAIINDGAIWSFELKKYIIPIIYELHDQILIAECKKIKSLKKRLHWIALNPDQKHLYAFASVYAHRFGADLPNHENINNYFFYKTKATPAHEIINLIQCWFTSRVNQARSLTKLETKKFNNHHELKQAKQADGTFRLDWQPLIEIAIQGKYKAIFVRVPHQQGKTEIFIKTMFEHSQLFNGGVVISNRIKLMNQLSDILKCFNYLAYDEKYMSGILLKSLGGLAVCIHSLCKDYFCEYVKQSSAAFIDEASQVLKTIFVDKNIIESVLPNLTEAMQKKDCIYFTDADLTTQDIKHYQELFKLKDDEILIVTSESPPRDYVVEIFFSSAPRYYKTEVINFIIDDLKNNIPCNIPCILAIEGEAQARNIFNLLNKQFPQKEIILLTGKMPSQEVNPFLENIVDKSARADLIIHTSVIGSGISVQHENKRFRKGYGLFSGHVLSPTECLQMMRRFRDITYWKVGLLVRPNSMLMTSYYKDLGAESLSAHSIVINPIKTNIKLNKKRNSALFIHAFVALLQDYNFNIVGTLSSGLIVDDLPPVSDLRAEDAEALLNAAPLPLKEALRARERHYRTYTEQFSAESSICCDYFKIPVLTLEAAEAWCNPVLRQAFDKQDLIIKILKLDPSIPNVQSKRDILILAGVTLELFKPQRLNQDAIKTIRDAITSQCAALYGLDELLPEKYCKANKIPKDRPLGFVKDMLLSWGLKVKRTRTKKNDREYQLIVSVSPISVSQHNLDRRTDEELLRDRAIELKASGLGAELIGRELGKTKLQVQRLLKR